MNDSLWIKQVATLSQLVRIQVSRFAEALKKEDLSTICFIYQVTEGERERRPLPIDVFKYLEERGEIDYSRPEQLIDLMRLLKHEKWAQETQQLVECHRLQTSLHYPVEESSVILRPREIATQIRDKRKAMPLNLPEDEADGSYNGRVCNHTCAKCNEQLRAKLQSPQLAEEIQRTINKFCATNLSCAPPNDDEEDVEPDVGVRVQQRAAPFIRKGSTMSHKSTRSSGYGSMVIEQFENPLILLEETETASTATSPTLSSIASSGLDQELLCPQPGASKALSRQSSTEEYYTADETTSEENVINSNSVVKEDTTLCHNVSPRRHLWEDTGAETTIVTPPSNREVIIGSMEVNIVDLKQGLEAGRTKAFKSYPFPSFGPCFQIQLFSSDSTDYAIHLLTKPSLTSSLSHMSVRVCVYEGDQDIPVHDIPSSLIYTSTHEIDYTSTQTTALPATTSSLTTADYNQHLAMFPRILTLNELLQITSRTLIIKAFLEYNVMIPQ